MPTKAGTAKTPRGNKFEVRHGVIPPSSQILLFKDDKWEEFILAAARQRTLDDGSKYGFVKRLGGAGDGGRDIEARLGNDLKADEWHLYQAKHYGHGLAPSEVFPEMAKFFKQLALGTYPRPALYYLCAPRAVGNDLHNLLANDGDAFRATFVDAWLNGHTGMKQETATLTPAVRAKVDTFDFKRFRECQVNDLLTWHALDRATHHAAFGYVAKRGDDDAMPAAPAKLEDKYVDELVRVYGEELNDKAMTRDDIPMSAYAEHFESQRQAFYCAEGLHRFSRDLYPDEPEFDKLLDMILAGLKPSISHPKYKTGMDRLVAALDKVSTLQLQESCLSPQLRGGDLPGTCHHLVDKKNLRWVK